MLRNNVLIPPEDLSSGSEFSVMKPLLSETIFQVEFSSLILGINHGNQIKLDIQYYIYTWLHGNRIQCPLQARSHKGTLPLWGHSHRCSHSEPLMLDVDPTPRTAITAAPDNWWWCDFHSQIHFAPLQPLCVTSS